MKVLGIDFGGSGIKGAVVDTETGELVTERLRLATPEGARPLDVAGVVTEIIKRFDWKGLVGMGYPGVVMHGEIFTAANVDKGWIGINAEEMFSEATGTHFFVLNDADAAGLAEMRFGIGKEFQKGVVLFLTIGTGIGSAFFNDGVLFPNTELGHLEVRGKDAERRASDATRQRKELGWEEWAARLQEVLATYENLFWPDLIVLGGGVSKEWKEFGKLLTLRTKVMPARLLNQAGIIGAALFAENASK